MMLLFDRSEGRLQAVLKPSRLIRWVYVGRLSVAWAVLIAAFSKWLELDSDKTLIVMLTFVLSHIVTVASFAWSDIQRRPFTETFFYLQLMVDLLVVTAAVHVTDGQVAALYILVNAVAAIFLPVRGAMLVAALGIVLYAADVSLLQATTLAAPFILQVLVFALAAAGSSLISAQLKVAGVGREALEAELKRVRLREADILRNIGSGIISVDETGELLFANASASELLGSDLEARVGTPILDYVHAVAPGLAEALRRATSEGWVAARSEGTLRRGELTVALGVTTTIAPADEAVGGRTITAIFKDISDQKRLEQLNLRAQRLEAVAELSASLAHEIKNPLASIRSAVEQISARPAANDDERTLGRLIVRESDRLSRLLSEFLDFSRVRVTKRELVDLGGVVRGAVRLAEAHPGRAPNSTIEVTITGDPLAVTGDEDLLHRAIFNLVLNALQATRPGTAVRVTAGPAPPERLPRGVPSLARGAVAIDVTDEGAGIATGVRERLFEPFTTTKVGGTGLGLAIAYRAIEAHRGVVLVDTGDTGSRFRVLIPYDDATPGVSE